MAGGGARAGAAAGHRLTAEAAVSVLRDGGSAVDAAIAALFAACVCEPVLASPGGGGFMMIAADGSTDCLDFFVETPPQRPGGPLASDVIEADFGTARQRFTIGAGTSAVPGMVPGLFAAHGRHGRLPMAALVAPAVSMARGGFAITRFQAFLAEVIAPILMATAGSRRLFGTAAGDATVQADSHFRNPDLADALEEIAREGVAAFADGEIARQIAGSQAEGGTLDIAALSAYRPEWRTPLQSALGAATVFLNPPPSAGGALIGDMLARNGTAGASAFAGAMAATDRAWLAAGRSLARFLPGAAGGPSAPRGTTHVSVFDADGMAVAATVSNGEGNGIVVPGCGFMVNNMLGEDDVNPAGVDRWVPGIRLSSMMAPTVAREAGAMVALGSGGSNRIRTALYQVLVRHLSGAMPLDEAVAAPRLHVEAGHLDVEAGFPGAEQAALVAAFPDHRVWTEPSLFFGGVHAVRRTRRGAVAGTGDARRDGIFMAA